MSIKDAEVPEGFEALTDFEVIKDMLEAASIDFEEGAGPTDEEARYLTVPHRDCRFTFRNDGTLADVAAVG